MIENPKYEKALKPLIKVLPAKPGVYQYFDDSGKIIYIGKAKNLKKRVSSYFNKDLSLTGKLKVLVKKIADIKFVVVQTELDAILLENNLIKKYQPRYNVMLKDDKTFPWICIKMEPFPQIFPTRTVINNGSEYFGPYASVPMMKTLLDMIRQLYQIRTCKLNLSPQNIKKKKFKVCLEYHMGKCLGPCEGKQTEEDYLQTISQIKEIIKGNISSVQKQMKETMLSFASSLEFEKAQILKEKIQKLENYRSKSTIVNPSINDVDVFSIFSDEQSGFVNYLKVIQGAIVQAHTVEIRKKLDETDDELLNYAITDFRERFSSTSTEIIVPLKISLAIPCIKISIPQIGDKKKLLEFSERNCRYYRLDKQKQKDLVDPERHTKRILQTIQKDLHLGELPRHIECFDNSNIQGAFPVAALVVFRDAKPTKNEYRHFNIKTVEGPNDFASMEEVVYRRYLRLVEEEKSLPQLIIIDGGKGQLSSALKSLKKLNLRDKISIIGIAKKLEEIYFPEDSIPLYLDKKSETLKIIQQARDEAHRFGITHHRKRRSKDITKSVLTDIPNIGFHTAQELLWKFKSVKRIKAANLDELQENIGKVKGQIVFEFFREVKKG